jgi:D-erythro-7,8-dihydroneopterin triphosphate epimerase
MLIRIKNLTFKTIVGVNAWEREEAQEVVINIEIEFDGRKAAETDSLDETVDYKKIKKRILEDIESSKCFLLESLGQRILNKLLEDGRILRATVEVDKPKALRFADSVSVVCSLERKTGRLPSGTKKEARRTQRVRK